MPRPSAVIAVALVFWSLVITTTGSRLTVNLDSNDVAEYKTPSFPAYHGIFKRMNPVDYHDNAGHNIRRRQGTCKLCCFRTQLMHNECCNIRSHNTQSLIWAYSRLSFSYR